MSVAVGSHDFKNTIVNGQKGDIEGTTTQIEDEHVLLSFLLVHAIGNSSSGGLVDNSHDGKAGNGTSILGGLTLSIVKVLKSVQDVSLK